MAEAFTEDDILSAEPALRLLTEGGAGSVWTQFDRLLAQEREAKMQVALFDEKTSRKFYAGYITALDMLRGMPDVLLKAADDIRARRDAEARVQAASRSRVVEVLTRQARESEASVL